MVVTGRVNVSVCVLEGAVRFGSTVTLVGIKVDSETDGKLVGNGWTGGRPSVCKVVLMEPVVSGKVPVASVVVGTWLSEREVIVAVCRLRLGSANVVVVSLAEVVPWLEMAVVCRAKRLEEVAATG
jgi:hypothetical protein